MFLGYKPDEGPWSSRDRELAKALILFEQSRCSGCGQDSYEAQDADTDGWWRTETVTCQACAALAKAQEDADSPGAMISVSLDPEYKPKDAG